MPVSFLCPRGGNSAVTNRATFSLENGSVHPFAIIRRLVDLSRRSQRGQGMVEYALILVLIAVVVIAILILLGNQVQNVFCNISGGLGT